MSLFNEPVRKKIHFVTTWRNFLSWLWNFMIIEKECASDVFGAEKTQQTFVHKWKCMHLNYDIIISILHSRENELTALFSCHFCLCLSLQLRLYVPGKKGSNWRARLCTNSHSNSERNTFGWLLRKTVACKFCHCEWVSEGGRQEGGLLRSRSTWECKTSFSLTHNRAAERKSKMALSANIESNCPHFYD